MKKLLLFKKMPKKKHLIIISICVMILVTGGYFFTHRKSKPASLNYLTTKVDRGTIEDTLEGSGTLQPSERYTLKTKAGGTVNSILVTEGTPVKKGQPLLCIDNPEVAIQAKQAELEWEIARNDLNTLLNASTETDYEIRSAALKVEQYKLALQNKLDEKDSLIIKAPFSGTILDMDLKVGKTVNNGDTVLSFATSDGMEVVANFSADVINTLSPGMETKVFVTGLAETYAGVVKEIAFSSSNASNNNNNSDNDRTGNTTAGKFEAIITVINPDENLKPGMETYNTVILASDQEQDLFLFKQASGYLRYTESENITAEVNGTIAEIYHREGEKVFKDELLLYLENKELDRQIKEAENQLAIAEEELRKLLNPDEETRRQQELKVAQNEQEMSYKQEKLNSLTVTAPIDGIVVSLEVLTGDELIEGQELIVISNFAKNTLEISVDELDINKLRFDQEAQITIDALPETTLTGKVIGIAQEGTTSDGVTIYPVTLEVDYTEGIKGGMTASATIQLEKRKNVLRIPAEALITNNNQTMVRLAENGQFKMQPIKIGLNNGHWVEVLEGLKEGQEIVLVAASAEKTNENTMTRMQVPGGPGGMGMPGGGQIRIQTGTGNSGNSRQRN